jgi:hypothetical protein
MARVRLIDRFVWDTLTHRLLFGVRERRRFSFRETGPASACAVL